jgi:hypothetical protein
MGILDSPKIHAEVVSFSEGPLGEQKPPSGRAQGFAGRSFLLLVLGQQLMGFLRQDLDAGKDLIGSTSAISPGWPGWFVQCIVCFR